MRILVANFFPAFHPPRSGGEQRYYYRYHYLSRHHDLTLVSPTYSSHALEVVTFSPTFREHRVPKDQVFDRLHWKLGAEGIGPECSAYVVALAAAAETQFGHRFQALAANADLIIHESPFTFTYDRTLGHDGKPRIYDSYNVEHRLAAQMLRGKAGKKAAEFIRFLEQSLVETSSLVFACSEEEREQFIVDFGIDPTRVRLAPNGFEPDATGATEAPTVLAERDRGQAFTVFMGSGHPPNVEAALFIVERLAPLLPEIEFRLMGAVCAHLPKALPRNVTSLGFVEENEKRSQLAACTAALNPLFSGAGTNLKMLDYMAAAAPIVTTPIGARGLALQHGVDAFIVDSERYGEALRAIVQDRPSARSVGAAAKRKAFADFTWEHLAERFRSDIESAVSERDLFPVVAGQARRSLLVVNDFPVAHATGGGQVRIRELVTELGREFNVVFLCLTQEPQRVECMLAPGVVEVRIPKTVEHRDADVKAGREATVSINDIIAAEFCAQNLEFVAAFRGYVAGCAAVIFEHPYLAPLIELVPTGTRIVYSSLNVESELKSALLGSRRDSAQLIARVVELERCLLDRADLVVCVSEQDRTRFERDFPGKRFEVIENGARSDLRDWPSAKKRGPAVDALRGRMLAVFVGSAHLPNIHAARFLLQSVAPAVPEITFGIIGSVCDAIALAPRPHNVVLFGILDEAEKNLVLARAAVAVNPMFEGGGSSLKVPDFFFAGLPLISTRIGVRGYDLCDGEHYVVAERANFADRTRQLAADKTLRQRVARNARTFAETALDWRILGARYRRALRFLVSPEAKPRALVVTYRFADPPPGGAEAFLVNVLREAASRGRLDIDVATCDVGAIANKWHFSAEYSKPEPRLPDPPYLRGLHRFAVDPARDSVFEHCSRLFAVWMAESRLQAALLPLQYDRPLLLGGWNFPEASSGRVTRWTSREAQIHVGQRATAVTLGGYAPTRQRIDVMRGAKQVESRSLNGQFTWALDLPGHDPILVLRMEKLFATPGDPRELGVVIHEISVREGSKSFSLDLADDFAAAARRQVPDRWVKSLIDITGRRDRRDDDLFVEVRGPHSAELEDWLLDNIASYDVVLAQGVPFSTPVEVSDIATRQRVPVVLLPHFHMEDRYYHWRQYYDMFRRANCVIAAPAMVKSSFFDAIGATSALAPGGGIDPGEYEETHLDRCRQAFHARHDATAPFVVILGRKTGAKNYRMGIEAVEILNRDGHRVDLVLIGPDDDGIAVTAPYTYYYGVQPRDVVLGALALSLCLVNMSESESFGIVLLEAWCAGTPVIAQRKCMAFSDLVVSGQNGFVAESTAEVAGAIDAYLSKTGLAARHAKSGRLVAEQYSWAHVAERIERILLDAARQPDARAVHERCS